MEFLLDLRYVLPPFMNIFFFILLTNQDKPWNPVAVAAEVLDSPYLGLKLALSVLATFLLLFFLHVSFQLPITISPLLILCTRHGFSIALLLSLAASILLPPSLFWFFFLCIIVTYPWQANLFDLSASFSNWFARSAIHSHVFHQHHPQFRKPKSSSSSS